MFVFASVLLFGPEAGAHACGRQRPDRGSEADAVQTLFNFGSLALSVWISGHLFFLAAGGIKPLFREMAPSSVPAFAPLLVLAVSYFCVNSGLIATAIAFAKKRSPLAVWREHFPWLGPDTRLAPVSRFCWVALHMVHFSAPLLLPPLLAVFYFTMRSSFGRVEDAKGHVAALNRLYLQPLKRWPPRSMRRTRSRTGTSGGFRSPRSHWHASLNL
jgi:hypothetical protein